MSSPRNPSSARALKDDVLRSQRFEHAKQAPSVVELNRLVWRISEREVVGEAAARLTQEAKALVPEVEWYKISGFRNIAIHEYWRLNPAVVEAIAVNYLPPLRDAISRIATEQDDL